MNEPWTPHGSVNIDDRVNELYDRLRQLVDHAKHRPELAGALARLERDYSCLRDGVLGEAGIAEFTADMAVGAVVAADSILSILRELHHAGRLDTEVGSELVIHVEHVAQLMISLHRGHPL